MFILRDTSTPSCAYLSGELWTSSIKQYNYVSYSVDFISDYIKTQLSDTETNVIYDEL